MLPLRALLITALFNLAAPAFADSVCCGKMGGVSYCDSSAGRLVCKNGFYSACYCDRHAVMDLQLLKGCCLWQGGVNSNYEAEGVVTCNNGTTSEVCSTPSNRVGVH